MLTTIIFFAAILISSLTLLSLTNHWVAETNHDGIDMFMMIFSCVLWSSFYYLTNK